MNNDRIITEHMNNRNIIGTHIYLTDGALMTGTMERPILLVIILMGIEYEIYMLHVSSSAEKTIILYEWQHRVTIFEWS